MPNDCPRRERSSLQQKCGNMGTSISERDVAPAMRRTVGIRSIAARGAVSIRVGIGPAARWAPEFACRTQVAIVDARRTAFNPNDNQSRGAYPHRLNGCLPGSAKWARDISGLIAASLSSDTNSSGSPLLARRTMGTPVKVHSHQSAGMSRCVLAPKQANTARQRAVVF